MCFDGCSLGEQGGVAVVKLHGRPIPSSPPPPSPEGLIRPNGLRVCPVYIGIYHLLPLGICITCIISGLKKKTSGHGTRSKPL